MLDAIIDSAGGDIMTKTTKMMKPGAVVSCYGMWVDISASVLVLIVDRTAVPSVTMTMREVLKNIELKGVLSKEKA